MVEVQHFLHDRIKSLQSQQTQAWHLLQWATSTHANCPNLFSIRDLWVFEEARGRTSLGEESRDNGGWLLNGGLLGRGFLLPEIPRRKAELGGRRTCAGLFKGLLQPLPQLLTQDLLSPLRQWLQQVPALEGTFFLVACQNFPEEWKQEKKN